MRVVLMKCAPARCAMKLMGSLAESYGYALASDPIESGTGIYEEGGEALTISDPHEVWVFHILADNTGKSAVWSVQRAPSDRATIVANSFIIRKMDLFQPDWFMASKNIFSVAKRAGLWNGTHESDFDFVKAYATDARQINGWGTRRQWYFFSRVSNQKFKPDQKKQFPFSVKVDNKISLEDMRSFVRSHFEGTEFDTSQGIGSGPYGNPNRYDRKRGAQYQAGYFERAFSLHRTQSAYVAETRPSMIFESTAADDKKDSSAKPDSRLSTLIHFAQHILHSSLFIPFYSSTKQMPTSYETGALFKQSIESSCLLGFIGN